MNEIQNEKNQVHILGSNDRNQEIVKAFSSIQRDIDPKSQKNDINNFNLELKSKETTTIKPIKSEVYVNVLKQKKEELVKEGDKIVREILKRHVVVSVLLKPVFLIKPKLIEHALEKHFFDPLSIVLAKYVSDWSQNASKNGSIEPINDYFEKNLTFLTKETMEIIEQRVNKSKVPGVKAIYRNPLVQSAITREMKESLPILVDVIKRYTGELNLPYEGLKEIES